MVIENDLSNGFVLVLLKTISFIAAIKSIPARFDASNIVVEQFQTSSKDGEKIPYFVVRQKDIIFDGSNQHCNMLMVVFKSH